MKTLLSLLLLIPSLSWGNFMNGNTLLEYCESNLEYEKNFCYGTIAGSLDTIVLYNSYIKSEKQDDEKYKFCNIDKIGDVKQAVDVVINFLKINPKNRNGNHVVLIDMAISDWLSCGYYNAETRKLIEDRLGYNF